MIAWRLLKKLVPKNLPVKWNESELSVIFPNGAIIELKGADNEDSLRGAGVWGMVVDEFATIYNKWAVWHEVLRPTLTDKKGWSLFIGTPKGKDAFYELFLKGQREEDGFKSWQFTTKDNPYIDPEEVESAKKEMPDRYFRQEYLAKFEDFVGLIWPEYSKSHLIEPIEIPESWHKVGVIDPAVSGWTGSLKAAIDTEENIYLYEEYREENKRVDEVTSVIRADLDWLIDPASKSKNVVKEGKIYSLYNEYMDHGIVANSAENDVDYGINRVAEYFKNNKIKIFNTLKWLPWELERYHWSESTETKQGIVTAKPYKKDDHLVDCLRYIIASRPRKGMDIKTHTPELHSAEWFEKYYESQRRGRGRGRSLTR